MEIYICADFSQDGIEMLRVAGHTVRTGGWGFEEHILTEEQLIEQIGNADVLIVGYEEVSRKVLENTHLKAISSIRGGPRANIDVDYATELGIPVFYTFGREAIPVADFTLGQILAVTRKIARADRELRRGVFAAPDMDYGSDKDVIWDMTPEGPWQARKGIEMQGKTIGLIGFGTVGKEVAKRAKSFGMQVIVYDPYQDAQRVAQGGGTKVEIEQLLKSADIISFHAKITDKNKGMIGEREFGMMKDGVYVVNNARAGLMDEQALRNALKSGKLGGLALDVFHQEPIKSNDEFFNYDNVVLTPHIAGSGRDVIYLQSVMLVNDLMLYFGGGRPKPVVNPEVFDKIGR
ncbi:MAG: NAD(P)-dependent oxidoreductase [Christensenella sp.]|nr:NAD(P)-dependent oxidoreductase [Christensenella sp.]